jgi:hypothetical protein
MDAQAKQNQEDRVLEVRGSPVLKYEEFNLEDKIKEIRKGYVEDAKRDNTYQAIKDAYAKPTGVNPDKRWVVTNKEFKPLKDLLAQGSDPITKKFAEKLAKKEGVEQFIMTPEMAFEVQKLTKSIAGDLKSIEKLTPKVMPPYPRMCVEMPFTAEVSGMRNPIEDESQMQLQRVGAYIETGLNEDGTLMFTFEPYYEFVSGHVNFSNVVLVHDNNKCLDLFLHFELRDFGMIWNAMFNSAMLETAIENNVPPEQFWGHGKGTDLLMAMAGEAVEEVPSLFFAWLVLLNSKSGITKTKVNPRFAHPKLGKRERARRGRSGYTIVSLTDTEDVDSEGLVTRKHIVNAHRVRGHFKAKRSGLYWWRPHIRGVGELKEREAYKITT